jgi:hypothetical protein
MPSPTDFPARGKVLRVEGDLVVFNPAGTNYELHLKLRGAATPPAPSPYAVSALIRCTVRKLWTMPGGGNFVTPIFGAPKVAQGRVRYLEERLAVIQAGTPILLSLPPEETSYDLINGPVAPGVMINATLLAGGTIELLHAPAPGAVAPSAV